jgi:speckle-type POZ protein
MSGNSTSADSHAQGRSKTTASKCVTESVTAAHNFEVADFSLLYGMGVGKFVGSTTFSVAGCDWNIRIYPDGSNTEDNGAYVSVFLYFRKGVNGVRVKFSLSLLNKDASMSTLRNPMLFKRNFGSIGGDWGHEKFMEKSKLQEFLRLNHDNFTVRCDLTVIGESRSDEVEAVNTVVFPPANLDQDLARMLKDGEGADVTFDVDGKLFTAHRCLLAARSPVFKALLFGPMKANAAQHIKIDDIEPAIFEAFLHFIYTDSIQYGVDRLRLMCEARLCRGIDVLTVGTTLALAERHHCIQLKDACLEFIASHDMLGAIMETAGFKHLLASCPFIMKEILDKIADARAGAR